tara:strand:+ start:150 stop:419 length:270 start_codon:yes stop_codon:yes gene_type:complete
MAHPHKSKGKSGGKPHGRTVKEKVSDFTKGIGLTSKQKKAREFIKGGLLATSGIGANIAAKFIKTAKAASKIKKPRATQKKPYKNNKRP